MSRSVLTGLLLALCCLVGTGQTPSGLPDKSPAPAKGYSDAGEVRTRIAASGPHAIEGLWTFPGSGSVMAIERMPGSAGEYELRIVTCDDRAVRPGTLLGVMDASGDKNTFDARIYTHGDSDTGVLSSAKRFTLRLDSEGTHLAFERTKGKYRINLWRLMPYLFRFTVRAKDRTGVAPSGCVRLDSERGTAERPRYL